MIFNVQNLTARDLRPGDIIVRWNDRNLMATEVVNVWHNPMRRVYEVASETAVLIGPAGVHQYRKGVELYPPRELIGIIRNPEPNADTCFC